MNAQVVVGQAAPERAGAVGRSTAVADLGILVRHGILMPRGVPQPVMAKLREAMLRAITDPAYVERQAQGVQRNHDEMKALRDRYNAAS